ncbi:hypothetical protein ABT168_15970 [Streptomyces sp. NPDC001793]|uniref:hypothetical protein n=1 Tax=Streptomyces sp. NPDC001793 TaxID=3154657 RepID=UPI003328C50D
MSDIFGNLRDAAYTALGGEVTKETVFTIAKAEGKWEQDVVARAPEGFRVISGGFETQHDRVWVHKNHITEDGRAWIVRAVSATSWDNYGRPSKERDANLPSKVTAFAVCVRVQP